MSTMDAINSNEDKYMIKVSEDDAINAKFNTKLQELLDIAALKQEGNSKKQLTILLGCRTTKNITVYKKFTKDWQTMLNSKR